MSLSDNISKKTENAIASLFSNGRSPHAVLVDGSSEAERDRAARLIAKTAVCGSGSGAPCGMCEGCRKADENIHPDIITVSRPDDKKFYVKKDLKQVVSDAYSTPNEAEKKAFILREVQYMNEESQNVLLKILEEPPAYTAFILTSENANNIIKTILSRVVRIRLGENENDGFSEKAVGIAADFLDSACSPYDFDRISALAPLESNKPLTEEVMSLLILCLRDAAALKSGGKILNEELSTQIGRFAEHFTLQRILEMFDDVQKLLRSTENYPNYTLLTAVLSAKI